MSAGGADLSALRVLVVGAGPAGTRAVETLLAHGVKPVVVDEAPRNGGQIYRQPPPGFRRPAKALYGFEAQKARRIHAVFAATEGALDYRPETLVWNLSRNVAFTLDDNGLAELPYDALILATGAMDRTVPLPGWTTPGVFSLGGSQVALKYQGCAVGRRVAFLGTGPLLYLVAYQYTRAGAGVAAVLDTASFGDGLRALPGLAASATTLLKGLWYRERLRLAGIARKSRVTPLAIESDEGGERVTALRYRVGRGREKRLACDAVALGYGLKPETQLAELAGAELAFDGRTRQWLPAIDDDGRASAAGVYLAGDGAGIAGADAAELRGELAALALLADRAVTVSARRMVALRRRLARFARFRAALETAFPYPARLAPALPDETIVCRCEMIRAGEIRTAARELGATEMNRCKALTRLGMGRCQARLCGLVAAEILADATGLPLAAVGRLRGQGPIKPLPIRLAHGADELAPGEAA